MSLPKNAPTGRAGLLAAGLHREQAPELMDSATDFVGYGGRKGVIAAHDTRSRPRRPPPHRHAARVRRLALARRWNEQVDANGLALLAAWRHAGRPIIHVRHDSVQPGSTLAPGAPGNAFRPGFEPLP